MIFLLVLFVHFGHAITETSLNSTNITTTVAPSVTSSVTQPVTQSITSSSNKTFTESVTESPLQCVVPCSCYIKNGNLTVKCNISLLPNNWKLPDNYTSLDLSYNGITKVPTSFFKNHNLGHLLILSLRGNNLTIIEENALLGLENLETLDISFTNLKEIKGDLQRILPSLKYLKAVGNNLWMPTDNVFRHKLIHEIDGVGWTDFCNDCTLFNHKYTSHINVLDGIGKGQNQGPSTEKPVANSSTVPTQKPTISSTGTIKPGPGPSQGGGWVDVSSTHHFMNSKLTDHAQRIFEKWGFLALCKHPANTLPHEAFQCQRMKIWMHNKESLILPTRLFYIAYVFGSIGILLNFSIIFIYAYSTNIRKINSMLLISNMAFCDILIGIYGIIIAKNNLFNLLVKSNFQDKLVLHFCKVAAVLFTVGQTVSVCTALLLTIDKFLSIVYCMDPNLKLSRRLSLLVLLLCWVGAIAYAFAPEFSLLRYSPSLQCTFPLQDIKGLAIVLSLLVLLYLANIPLYGKIFLFVRRSSVRMGVRRDSALAKKIAVLVLTNFVFFAVPMILILIFSFLYKIHNVLDTSQSLVRFIVCYFAPVICLCFNSCLNPFLCAFRQRQFRREFKKCMRNVILSRFCKAFSTLRKDSSVRNTQPTRVEMYKLSNIDSQVQSM